MQMAPDIFIFSYKGNLILLFFIKSKFNYRSQIVTKGNLTLVFHKGVNSIRANKSSAPVPTRCLLFLVTKDNLTLLFFIWEEIFRTRGLLFLVINGNLTLLFFIWK